MFQIQLKEFGSVLMVKLYAHKSNPALKSTDIGKIDRSLRFSLRNSIRSHYLAVISGIKIEKKKDINLIH